MQASGLALMSKALPITQSHAAKEGKRNRLRKLARKKSTTTGSIKKIEDFPVFVFELKEMQSGVQMKSGPGARREATGS